MYNKVHAILYSFSHAGWLGMFNQTTGNQG